MIERYEIEPFLDKYVAIGVQHDIIPDKLFFYYGYIKYIDDIEIKLEMDNGYKIIPLTQIYDMHLGGGHDR